MNRVAIIMVAMCMHSCGDISNGKSNQVSTPIDTLNLAENYDLSGNSSGVIKLLFPYLKNNKSDLYHFLVLSRNLRKDSLYNTADSIYRIALEENVDSQAIRKIAREYAPLLNDMGKTKEARHWTDIAFSNINDDSLNVLLTCIVRSSYYLVSYYKDKNCNLAKAELWKLDSLAKLDGYSIYPRTGILYNDSMIKVMCQSTSMM